MRLFSVSADQEVISHYAGLLESNKIPGPGVAATVDRSV